MRDRRMVFRNQLTDLYEDVPIFMDLSPTLRSCWRKHSRDIKDSETNVKLVAPEMRVPLEASNASATMSFNEEDIRADILPSISGICPILQ